MKNSRRWENFRTDWWKFNFPFSIQKTEQIVFQIDYKIFSTVILYVATTSKIAYYIAEYSGGYETNGVSFPFAMFCFCISLICLSLMVVLWASIESKEQRFRILSLINH